MCCLTDPVPESDVCSAFWIDCLIMQNEENISRTTQTGQNKSNCPKFEKTRVAVVIGFSFAQGRTRFFFWTSQRDGEIRTSVTELEISNSDATF